MFNAYSEGEEENVLYVQNGQRVKCQRRHVTSFVDKLVGTLVLFVPCRTAESSVSFSRCNVSDASAVALELLLYTCREFRLYFTRAVVPPPSPCETLEEIDDDRACFYVILSHNKLLVNSPTILNDFPSLEFSRSKVIRKISSFRK